MGGPLTSTKQWWNYAITNPFGVPEGRFGVHSGIDFATPNDTPIAIPVSGTVIESDYKPWGGQVAVKMDNQNVIAYFLHLDNLNVKTGDKVNVGQIVGTSGGGIGDKLLSGSNVITVSNQGQYNGFSSGYHTHFGLVQGTTVSDFETALGANIKRIDPTQFVKALIDNPSQIASDQITTALPAIIPDTSTLSKNLGKYGELLLLAIIAIVAIIVGVVLVTNTEGKLLQTGKLLAKASVL